MKNKFALLMMAITFFSSYSAHALSCPDLLSTNLSYVGESSRDTKLIDFYMSHLSQLSQPRVTTSNAAAKTSFGFTSGGERTYRHFNALIEDGVNRLPFIQQQRISDVNKRLLIANDQRFAPLVVDGKTVTQIRFLGISKRFDKLRQLKPDNPLITETDFARMLLNSLANSRLVRFMHQHLKVNGFVLNNISKNQSGNIEEIVIIPMQNNGDSPGLSYLILKYEKLPGIENQVMGYNVTDSWYLEEDELVNMSAQLSEVIL